MWIRITNYFSRTSTRFIAALLVLLLGFGTGISMYLRAFSEDSYSTRKNELQHIVSLAQHVIEPMIEDLRQGKITKGEARLRASEMLNHFVYSDGTGPNFVFLTSYEGYILVEPFKPDTVGTYQMQRRDKEGNPVIQDLLQVAKAGGGFVFYHEARTADARNQQKLSYVIGLPELECYIGTGMYVDDIERGVNTLLLRMLLLSFFIVVAVLGMQYYFIRPLLHCFYTMSSVFKEFDQQQIMLPKVNSNLIDTDQLVKKVQAVMEILKQDRIVLSERVAEVHRLAYSDPLTNLPNRASLEEWFKVELKKAAMGDAHGVIMFLDLNDFKRVNDLFGHSEGDKLLLQTANRINEILPNKGKVFRLGGDEFIVIIPDSDEPEAEKIAQALLRETACPYVFQEETFYVTGSLGIALYPQDGSDMENLLSKVDKAMYHAKKNKNKGFSRFNASMHEVVMRRVKLESALTNALERQQLELFYQPQFDVKQNKTVALEALLRWNREGKETISPIEFIPIAEESGLILEIGQWVLIEACKFCMHLHSLGHSDIYVTVNMSTKQVEQPDFVHNVRAALIEARLSPHFLELEMTESLFINSLESCRNTFRELKEMGIRLALDDFGTGHSSLTRLQALPFNVLKIDKEFLKEISSEQSEIIKTIIKLAHVLNMEVVVEGVETAEQEKFVVEAKGDRIQGYYFSPALSGEELIKYLC